MNRYCPTTRFESLKETNKKETNSFLKGNIRNKITATEDTRGTEDTGATKDTGATAGAEDTRTTAGTAGAASRWRDLSPSENMNTFKTKNNDRRDDDRYNDSRNDRYNDSRNDRYGMIGTDSRNTTTVGMTGTMTDAMTDAMTGAMTGTMTQFCLKKRGVQHSNAVLKLGRRRRPPNHSF